MPRTETIVKLAAALHDAGAARDWERLGALAHALAPQLEALRARGPWSPAELAALAQLKASHDEGAAACARELDVLGARLAEMRNNKEGWIAYALASENEAAGHQE